MKKIQHYKVSINEKQRGGDYPFVSHIKQLSADGESLISFKRRKSSEDQKFSVELHSSDNRS